MTAHTVSHNANSLAINLIEIVKDGFRQLGRDVAVHFVSLGPGIFDGVNVEAGARAEVVGVVFGLDFEGAGSETVIIHELLYIQYPTVGANTIPITFAHAIDKPKGQQQNPTYAD